MIKNKNNIMNKKQYIVRGAITTSLIPIVGFIPEIGWLLISIYSLPAFLFEKLLGIKSVLVVDEEIIIYPRMIGLLVTIPFWIVVGALIGWLVFYNAKLRARKKGGDIPPYRSREVMETILWIIAFYILFIGIIGLLFSDW